MTLPINLHGWPAGALCVLLAAPHVTAADTKTATMHYMKALLLQHQGQVDAALDEYEQASKIDSQSAFIIEQAAELALEGGRPARALDWAQRLVALDSKRAKSWLVMGNVRWARGEISLARKSMEEALRLDPKFPEAMLALGNLLNVESPESAKQYFQEYIHLNPERAPDAHYQIALVEERQGRRRSAIERLKEAIELAPNFLQARYALAHLYEVSQDTRAALGEYLHILEQEPQSAVLLNHAGELSVALGEAHEAGGYFVRAKSIEPKNPTACLWLAILAEQNRDFASAAAALSDSAALEQEAELNLRLSYYLTQAGRLQEAVVILDRAHARWPDNTEIAYFLALGYDDLKRPEKAIEFFREILGRAPDFRDARFQLAVLHERLGRIEDAEREFRVLLQQRPSDSAALNYLGYSLTDRGLKLTEAQGLIEKALAIEPDNGAYRDSLGWSYFKQGRLQDAKIELKAALQKLPEDPTVWEHLGDAYEVLGDSGTAWVAWRMSLLGGAEGERLRKKLAALEARRSPQALGNLWMEYFRRVYGGIEAYSGLCEITGSVAKKKWSFKALMMFESPQSLRLDFLGPFWVPLFRARVAGRTLFEMDPFPVDGISPEVLQEAVAHTLFTVRDGLSGRIFEGRPAEFHEGWRTHWVGGGAYQLFLDDTSGDLRSFQGTSDSMRILLDEFEAVEGRRVPTHLKAEAKNFSIDIRLNSPRVRFFPPAPLP
ncbi:MAG: tetratricopeptide repeat protein [Elusimicrobia bacterium]|nr:tetratricopeptide repeat protein [Elusimicrobiota bacterium]